MPVVSAPNSDGEGDWSLSAVDEAAGDVVGERKKLLRWESEGLSEWRDKFD